MPKFTYKAKEGPGKIVDGVINADSIELAIAKITQLGLTPIDIQISAQKKNAGSDFQDKKVQLFSLAFLQNSKLSDLVIFTRQMSDLVDAAVPILRSLQIVSQQTQHKKLKAIVKNMYNLVQDGGSFSDALAHYPEIFSQLYVNMIRTGEVSGNLDIVLVRLADYLEKEQETRSKIRSSLAYPAFVLLVGVATMFVLLSFVIPRLSVMFEDLDQALPLPTLILISVSDFFAHFWWVILIAGIFGGYYFRLWLETEKGKFWLDTTCLKIPVLGKYLQIVEVGRFARTLGTLVESGVLITTALNSVWATIENSLLRREIKKVSEEVTNGASLKVALKHCTFFPETAVNMMSVGEETGKLDKGLFKIADAFERQADQSTKTLISLLGPVVLVFIVGIVGFVVIAMLLPIFKMNMLIE